MCVYEGGEKGKGGKGQATTISSLDDLTMRLSGAGQMWKKRLWECLVHTLSQPLTEKPSRWRIYRRRMHADPAFAPRQLADGPRTAERVMAGGMHEGPKLRPVAPFSPNHVLEYFLQAC